MAHYDDIVNQWLSLIHRGGAFAHWWTNPGRVSHWWPVGKPTPIPSSRNTDVYVLVHPTREIPTTNARGEPVESRYARGRIENIAALACLYAEFDAKDYGTIEAALNHIQALEPEPSIVINSGGGYHAYWLLDEPHILTDANRKEAAAIAAGWVHLVGGDSNVNDIARVLRVPGTYNRKYTPARLVAFVNADFDRRYSWQYLAGLAAPFTVTQTLKPASAPTPRDGLTPAAERLFAAAIRKVSAAGDGERHSIALTQGRTLGGILALSEDRIVNALMAAYGPGVKDAKDLERTIRDAVAYGRREPWDLPEDESKPAAPAKAPQSAPQGEPPRIAYPIPISAETLAKKDITPPRYFIEGMLRAGLALFIGNPGIGKTPALIQLGLALATGGKWLGSIACPKCRVLYIGVEYEEGEIRQIITDSTGSERHPPDLYVLGMETFTSPKTETESIGMLEHYLTTYRYDAIVTDTLSGFLPTEKFKQNAYRGDYAEFLAYHRLLTLNRSVLVGSWHGGKYAKDPETAYNGGQGMWGSAGGGRLTMMRSDEDQQVRLRSQLRGHDRMEWVITQARVGAAHFWSLLDPDPDPIFGSDSQRRIYMAVKDHSTPLEPLTPQGIKAILGQDAPELGIKEPYIRQTLARLCERGILDRWNGGYIVKRRGSDGSRGSRVTHGSGGSDGSGAWCDPNDPTPIQPAIHNGSHTNAENAGRSTRSSDPRDPSLFATVPAEKRESLLSFLRSPEPAMQTRARLECAAYGIDYAAARQAAGVA